MPSPYPLSYGCIFREEFINPYLAAQNGLVQYGNPWLGVGMSGVKLDGSNYFTVPRLSPCRFGAITIIADVSAEAFTATYRIAFAAIRVGSGIPPLEVGYKASVNESWFVLNSARSAVYTPKKRSIMAWVGDGTNMFFYQDGAYLGTGASAISGVTGGSTTVTIGCRGPVGGTLYGFGGNMFEFSLYNYAMTSSEILQNFQLSKGLIA
jgi:hypothetical protein